MKTTPNIMRRRLVCVVLFAYLACLLNGSAHAIGLVDWANRADVVCIASYVSMEPLGAKTNPANGFESLVTDAVTMKVTALWKGTLTDSKIVLGVTHVVREGPYFPFVPFSRNRNYLIFAQKQEGTPIYMTLDPSSNGEGFVSAVLLGPVSSSVTPQMPLLTKIVRQVTAGLSDDDPLVRRTAMGYLGDFEWLYVQNTTPPPALPPGTDTEALRNLITTQAIPQILKLTSDKDEGTRFCALETAAWLQQTQVISAIGLMAESHSSYSDAVALSLLHYKNAEAVPLLIPQLANKNPKARLFTIEALEGLKDRRTVPFLIDLLGDTDTGVQDRAVYALYAITGLPVSYKIPSTSEGNATSIQFWQTWEKEHGAEIEQLRKAVTL